MIKNGSKKLMKELYSTQSSKAVKLCSKGTKRIIHRCKSKSHHWVLRVQAEPTTTCHH